MTGLLQESLLRRVSDWPDEFAPMDVVWAARIEMMLEGLPMPTTEQLNALAADWKEYRAKKIHEEEAK